MSCISPFLRLFGTCGILLAAATSVAHAGEKIVLVTGGTGSSLKIMELLGAAYSDENPDVRLTVLPSLGSGGGIKALLKDKIDFSLSARPLKDKETSRGAQARDFAVTPMVFVTRQETPFDDVTRSFLESAYTGSQGSWPDGTPVRVVMRPRSETDNTVLRSLSPTMDTGVMELLEQKKVFIAMDDQSNATALEKAPGSLGFASLGQIRAEGRQLKPLKYEGVEGSMETLRSGDYTFRKTLLLISTANLKPEAKAFLDFIQTGRGQQILRTNGFFSPLSGS